MLEENQVVKEQVEMLQKRLAEFQKLHIHEGFFVLFVQFKLLASLKIWAVVIKVGNFSKQIIIAESDKTDLKNQIQVLKSNFDDLLRKYNDAYAESHRRVTLQDHLNQTGELKR